ncbi:MAG: M28 family peptidase [Deltaproteobacteria bacterium]|nr:M28 family peptidase [Deltaproteobacteria bacterium]
MIRTIRSFPLVSSLLAAATLSVPGPSAWALTPGQIEAGAAIADAGVRDLTAKLASDSFEGRAPGTRGSERSQAYLIDLLRRIGPGLNGGTEDDDYKQPFAAGTNLLAFIRGRELPNEYVIVGAHYDHLGTTRSALGEDLVYNGATDNAAGTAAAVAVGSAIRALPEAPRRSVIIALWDAEEAGLLGSLHYVSNPPVPIEQTVAYVNFDILGAALTPAVARTTFAISSETGGEAFGALVDEAAGAERTIAAPDPLTVARLSYIFGQLRSDYASFVAAEVPTVFFSDATGACYHTVDDEAKLVDFEKLEQQTRIAYRLSATLAEREDRLPFVAPNPALATYDDAVILDRIVRGGITDLDLFRPEDQSTLRTTSDALRAIVDAGPQAFDGQDVQTVLGAALDTLAAIESSLECTDYSPARGRKPFLRFPDDSGNTTPHRLPSAKRLQRR